MYGDVRSGAIRYGEDFILNSTLKVELIKSFIWFGWASLCGVCLGMIWFVPVWYGTVRQGEDFMTRSSLKLLFV